MWLKTKKTKEISPDKFFYLSDGRVLKNLEELADALRNMTGEIFKHHVNKERNDFANWVNDVLEDKKLATDLKRAKTLKTILQKIEASL